MCGLTLPFNQGKKLQGLAAVVQHIADTATTALRQISAQYHGHQLSQELTIAQRDVFAPIHSVLTFLHTPPGAHEVRPHDVLEASHRTRSARFKLVCMPDPAVCQLAAAIYHEVTSDMARADNTDPSHYHDVCGAFYDSIHIALKGYLDLANQIASAVRLHDDLPEPSLRNRLVITDVNVCNPLSESTNLLLLKTLLIACIRYLETLGSQLDQATAVLHRRRDLSSNCCDFVAGIQRFHDLATKCHSGATFIQRQYHTQFADFLLESNIPAYKLDGLIQWQSVRIAVEGFQAQVAALVQGTAELAAQVRQRPAAL